MTKADAWAAANIHSEALAGDFLPSLGKSFLTTLYRCILDSDAGSGIVDEKNDSVVGVAVMTENSKKFFKAMLLKRFWALAPKVLFSLLKHPSLMKRILETIFSGKFESAESAPEAELVVIVLLKSYRRQGIGTELLNAVNEEFLRRGIKNYTVRTYAESKISNNFYNTRGFELFSSYMMYNRKWNIYKYNIQP